MNLNLKTLRKKAGLTQEQLAKMIGATKRQVGAWERGENDIPMYYAVDIADILNCSLDEIAGREQRYLGLELNITEVEMLRLFRTLDESGRDLLMNNARAFAELSGRSYRDAMPTAFPTEINIGTPCVRARQECLVRSCTGRPRQLGRCAPNPTSLLTGQPHVYST